MKILLYSEGLKTIGKSGLGKAIKHQMTALENEKIEYTLNPKDDYDILHINTWFLKSYFMAKKAKRMGKKVVYHAHSTEEDYKNGFIFAKQTSKLVKWWLIKCYSLGDVIVTPTPYSKKLLEGYKGLENKKIYAISNGIDLSLFKKDKKAGEQFRKEYGFKKTDKVIVGIGLYIERKGIVDFVELAKSFPKYKFIWFGYSPLKYSTKPVKDAVNTKLPNLTFAGYVEQDMIKAALNGCDLYIFPTYEETEGIPIIEACAVGANILVRDIPIFDDWLVDGKNVYKAKTLKEFKSKTKKIIEGDLKSVSKNAKEVAKERDINKIGKELKKVYTEVLKMPGESKEEKKKRQANNLKVLTLIFATISLLLAIFLNGNKFNFNVNKYEKVISVNGYNFNVNISSSNRKKANKIFDDVEDIISEDLKLLLNNNNELNYIYTNNNSSDTLTLSKNLYDALVYMDKLYKESNNYFDMYAGNIYDIWTIKEREGLIPTDEELNNIESPKLEFLDNYKITNNHANIHLENIIVGYILNDIASYFDENNIDIYLVSSRGNIITGDYYNKKGKYKVVLPLDYGDSEDIIKTVNIKNKAISLRNIYQNSFILDNVLFGGIINPNTSKPSDTMQSVYVIADNPLDASLYSLMLFNMSLDDGKKFASENDIDAMWAGTYTPS
mgnify:CR=1 FL=1